MGNNPLRTRHWPVLGLAAVVTVGGLHPACDATG